jgi:hypothetical protein
MQVKQILKLKAVGVVNKKIYTEKQIRQMATDFYNKWMPSWEVYCVVCKKCNCKNNDTCINCGSEL